MQEKGSNEELLKDSQSLKLFRTHMSHFLVQISQQSTKSRSRVMTSKKGSIFLCVDHHRCSKFFSMQKVSLALPAQTLRY